LPDAKILITADHSVHQKNLCIDLQKVLASKSIKIKAAVSAEKDKYFIHHRGFGGTSYIYLNNEKDSLRIKKYYCRLKE